MPSLERMCFVCKQGKEEKSQWHDRPYRKQFRIDNMRSMSHDSQISPDKLLNFPVGFRLRMYSAFCMR